MKQQRGFQGCSGRCNRASCSADKERSIPAGFWQCKMCLLRGPAATITRLCQMWESY